MNRGAAGFSRWWRTPIFSGPESDPAAATWLNLGARAVSPL